jgi:hypothetical protein
MVAGKGYMEVPAHDDRCLGQFHEKVTEARLTVSGS